MKTIGNNPDKTRQTQVVASGALPNGKPVVVNADGTVSVVSGSDSTAGTPVVFESANTGASIPAAGFDSSNNKVVIAYADGFPDGIGTAIVGTVSGTSISFGTPVVFYNNSTGNCGVTFDSNSNKVVITYTNGVDSSKGTAIVGTVSGTSISFGSPTVFNTGGSTNSVVSTFDSNSNKVVVAYQDSINSDKGTAIVGTVSGTSISFGSEVIFNNAATSNVGITFDSNSNKIVIGYRDSGNSSYGTAIVGTVSGTSISFGSEVVFESASVSNPSPAFDSNSNKVVIAYRDNGNSNYGTAIVGTVSGTNISFGTAVVFKEANSTRMSTVFDTNQNLIIIAYRNGGDSNNVNTVVGTVSGTSISFGSSTRIGGVGAEYVSATFDTSNNKAVISYVDNGNSNYGTAAVFEAGIPINLTAENYIGLAASGVPDGKAAKINLKGAVDENQSGLTAGQSYYVQTDGTLGTTPADPSVFAGTAVSANKLIVKG